MNKSNETGSAFNRVAAPRPGVAVAFQIGKETIKIVSPSTNYLSVQRSIKLWVLAKQVGQPASSLVSQSEACSLPLQGALGLNGALFVWPTLADLDRLGPERLFCLTHSMISLCVK